MHNTAPEELSAPLDSDNDGITLDVGEYPHNTDHSANKESLPAPGMSPRLVPMSCLAMALPQMILLRSLGGSIEEPYSQLVRHVYGVWCSEGRFCITGFGKRGKTEKGGVLLLL